MYVPKNFLYIEVLYFFSGMTAVICTYPLDMVRVRLAFQVKGEHTYTGIIHAFRTIYAKVHIYFFHLCNMFFVCREIF